MLSLYCLSRFPVGQASLQMVLAQCLERQLGLDEDDALVCCSSVPLLWFQNQRRGAHGVLLGQPETATDRSGTRWRALLALSVLYRTGVQIAGDMARCNASLLSSSPVAALRAPARIELCR